MLNSFANAAKIKAAKDNARIADSAPYKEFQTIVKSHREAKPARS